MSTHLKAAASSMIKDLEAKCGRPLELVRVGDSRIPIEYYKAIVINVICKELLDKQFITNRYPLFNLGSTRMISDWFNKSTQFGPFEVQNDLIAALQLKKSWGDIDVDVEMLVPPKDIGEYFINKYPNDIAYKLCGDKEINFATIIDDSLVVQIDLVNVLSNRKQTEYNQFSSFIDIQKGLKGLVREALANAATRTISINEEYETAVKDIVKQCSDHIKLECKATDNDQLIFDRIRWSLGHTCLKLIVVFKKIKNGKELKTPYNLELSSFPKQISLPIEYSYEPNMDAIAKVIGFSSGGIMYHSVKMLEEIEKFDIDRKQLIWDDFNKILERKKPTETAGGQLSLEEAEFTINFIKPYFRGIDYERVSNANKNA